MNSKNRFILINLLAFEFVLLNLVLIVFLFIRMPNSSLTDTTFLGKLLELAIIYNLSWLFIVLFVRDKGFYFNPNYRYIKNLLISLFFFVGLVTTLVILFRITYFQRTAYIGPIFIFSYLDLISQKYLMKYLKKRSTNLFSSSLLVGSGNEFSSLYAFTNIMERYGYNIVGCLVDCDEKSENVSNLKIVGDINDLPEILATAFIDDIFIDMHGIDRTKIAESIKIADSFGVRVKLIPENPMLLAKNYEAVSMGNLAYFKLRQSPLDIFSTTIVKRLFDFCFALLVILVFSPIYLLIAFFLYLDSKGPIIYAPHRKGEAGKTFKCYKFRTMSVNDNPLNGTNSTIVNDPRITRVGKFLRKTDLDELPQFFNVLKGEMSVIGPRPHRVSLHEYFRKNVSDYMVRSYIKPGITGWAQVNGWRGPTVTEEQKTERIRHDLWYIENWSFWLDIKIVFLTLFGKHHKKAF